MSPLVGTRIANAWRIVGRSDARSGHSATLPFHEDRSKDKEPLSRREPRTASRGSDFLAASGFPRQGVPENWPAPRLAAKVARPPPFLPPKTASNPFFPFFGSICHAELSYLPTTAKSNNKPIIAADVREAETEDDQSAHFQFVRSSRNDDTYILRICNFILVISVRCIHKAKYFYSLKRQEQIICNRQ